MTFARVANSLRMEMPNSGCCGMARDKDVLWQISNLECLEARDGPTGRSATTTCTRGGGDHGKSLQIGFFLECHSRI
jgi:hypothetical protein